MRGVDGFFGRTLQDEDDVDASQYQHTALHFDLSMRHARQVAFARRDPARLQRATQGAEQSSTGCRNQVVDGRRVRIRNVALDAVVARDRAMRAKAHRLGFGRHLRQTQGPLDARQRDLRSVDDVAHWSSLLPVHRGIALEDAAILLAERDGQRPAVRRHDTPGRAEHASGMRQHRLRRVRVDSLQADRVVGLGAHDRVFAIEISAILDHFFQSSRSRPRS